jgi:hypothetical protein
MCLYNTTQRRNFMLNTALINRLISLEGVVNAMFKNDAPDIAESLNLCINGIFSDMVKKHGEELEKKFSSEQANDLEKKREESLNQVKYFFKVYDEIKADEKRIQQKREQQRREEKKDA